MRSLPLVETKHVQPSAVVKDRPTPKRDVRQSLIKPFQDGSLAHRFVRKRTGRQHAVGRRLQQVNIFQPFEARFCRVRFMSSDTSRGSIYPKP